MAYVNTDGKLVFDKITSDVVVQANYLADRQDEHHIDDLIDVYTGLMPWNWGTPPCSHTEIGVWVDGKLWFFSSTSRKELGSTADKKNGTRWIKAKDLLRNPDRWLIQEKTEHIHCSAIISRKINRANDLSGLTYDFYGVGADFTNPIRVLRPQSLTPELIKKLKKIYCSKAVHAVDTGKLVVFSPKRRYKWAKKNGYIDVGNTIEWASKHWTV